MVVADKSQSLTISGNGDVVEPNDGIVGMVLAKTLLLDRAKMQAADFGLMPL